MVEPQGKPWALLRSPERTNGIFDKMRGIEPKFLVRCLVGHS